MICRRGRSRPFTALAFLAVAEGGCRADTRVAPGGADVAAVELSRTTLALPLGGTAALDVAVRDAAGNALPIGEVHWSTSDAKVARVSSSGVVTAVALGSATIAATVQGKSATAVLTVAPRPASLVRITPGALTLAPGQQASLSAAALDATGSAVTGVSVAWRSSNSAIASVDGAGRVTAVAAGATTIAATIGDLSSMAAVAVTAPPPTVARVTVSPTVAAIRWTGSSARAVQLTGATFASDGSAIRGATVSWSSSNDKVATVSANGLVTAIGDGFAIITATSGAASATAVITSSKK
jgi:uncharacterized protein YjdB